ncbi:glycine cleavage system T protein [Methylococcus capsulatus str. Bath]|uniref:Aminomethyltransferase n=1 Tax=Methylococcus capsulatus (strain ATCC 33009 / NCIMB 11132 / Bath) TaxID=243233 RepID=GCST_METCA|nr:glycine cleavage system aminomethyltransferase GcvT [Methylococcus capsulatus]Q60BW3.1 RecName: Full=Aminomethyltransferase; AltName: Full=Glycine cleavage system T protein [Methylococcus capsulatus str. Bath]AAU90545.1 glycine cleavage system T protein [Methylococcus capsulatus str. Bath]UQN11114.1 glycine cleavage system aminomethyltransferase GcvT [Methylococcus capsulatus]
MGRCTALHEEHLALGARMTEFSGWELPLHYGSQIAEHHAVRRAAGMFDVSHLGVVDVEGLQAAPFLRRVLANDVARLAEPGRMLYGCMLNQDGGIVDDLVVGFIDDRRFRLILNAGTREKDLSWLHRQAAPFSVTVTPRDDLAMIALQGPDSPRIADAVVAAGSSGLKPFTATQRGDRFIARTGYTGEDGFEIILPHAEAGSLWRQLFQAGARPCGLGARDTLRLEAGMRLYGQDMDETVTPLACGLGWTVAWEPEERDFIGRAALERERIGGSPSKFVGLILEEPGILRSGQKVAVANVGEGVVTSGGFSPTLRRSIGLARVPAATGRECRVEIRGSLKRATVVKPRFVRRSTSLIDIC